MDHQTFAQLLGNYGEFVGAIAVTPNVIMSAAMGKLQSRDPSGSA